MDGRTEIDKTFAAELRAAGMEIGAVASRLRACQARVNAASTWKTMHRDRANEMARSVSDLRRKLRDLEETMTLVTGYNPPARSHGAREAAQ